MKVEDLITDEAIRIVFQGTNFGIPHREVIAGDLKKISLGFYIGHTAKCCLLELGLIVARKHKEYDVTELGKKYLKILTCQEGDK